MSVLNIRIARTVSYFIAFAALGLAVASLGPTLPGLAERVASSIADISFLFTIRSFGFLLGSFFSGRFYDRLSGHGVMAVMILAMSASMAIMPAVTTLGTLLGVMLILGTAEGAVGVGGNALLVWVHGRRVAPFMNALHFAYGTGGFIAPLIVAWMLSVRKTIVAPYLVLAALMLPAAVVLLRLPSPRNPEPAGSEEKATRAGRRLVFLVALFLGLYIGAEVSYGGWIYTYVLRLNLAPQATAAYLTSLFWGMLTFGRLAGVPIAARWTPQRILLANLLGCFVSIAIALIWPFSLTAITVASAGIGLSMASIYPTALNFAERRVRITGEITGFLILGGSAGGMILPLVIGRMFESIGPRVMMIAILADLVLALLVYLMFVKMPADRDDPRREPAVAARAA